MVKDKRAKKQRVWAKGEMIHSAISASQEGKQVQGAEGSREHGRST